MALGWAKLIGGAISAYGNYKANKDNIKGQKDAFTAAEESVKPKEVSGGMGNFIVNPDGSYSFKTADKFQDESDYFLDSAAANKGWLSQYQEGGPTAAANTLYEQRAAPLRRQQEREKQLFEEQALARGMLQADPTDRAAARQTEAWGNVYGDVYNKSFMDVQDIIDRYRDRVSGSLNTAVGLENIPMSYAQFGADQGKAFSPVAQLGTEALSGAGTAAAEGTGQFFSGLGGDVAAGKFAIPRKSATAGTHTSFTPPKGGMIAGPIKGLLY